MRTRSDSSRTGRWARGVRAAVPLVVAALLVAPVSFAWENKETHQRLTDAAVARFDRDGGFDEFLRQHYELPEGLSTSLILDVDGPYPETPAIWTLYFTRIVQAFADGGRFNADQSGVGGSNPDDSILKSVGGEVTADIGTLFRTGVWAEDNPNSRARHHFHDPELLHPPPPENRGLDNQGRGDLLLGNPDAIELGTVLFRGGTWEDYFSGNEFDLTGLSALDRGLNRPSVAGGEPPALSGLRTNYFDLGNAERYLYRAVAGATEVERELAMGLHFLAVSHALHLLEDMSSPAHVRNDFVVDHLRPSIAAEAGETRAERLVGLQLETFAEVGGPPRFIGTLARASDTLFYESRPRSFIEIVNLLPFGQDPFDVSQFTPTLSALDPTGFDVGDFWQRGIVAPETGAALGLAEFVHDNFFSRETVPGLNPEGYSRPDPGTDCQRLPLRAFSSGGPVVDGFENVRAGLYLSSSLVPHLARCNFHYVDVAGVLGPPVPALYYTFSVIDNAVRWDYMELLFPTVIDYVEELLRLYFVPRIEVVPSPGGGFRLRNLTSLPFTYDAEAVEIAYDGEDGVRRSVPAVCGSGTRELAPSDTPGEPGPPGSSVCLMPTSIPVPANNRGDFYVIVRGKLGARGSVASSSGFDHFGFAGRDFAEEFVVAYDHVRSRVAFDRLEGTSADDSGELDIYFLDIDPTEAFTPDSDVFERVNLTDRFRAALGRPDLDLVAPAAEPEGVRVAIRSDRDTPQDGSGYTDVRAPLELFLLDPWGETNDPMTLVPIPHSQITGSVDRSKLRSSWTPNALALFYLDNLEDPGEEAPDTPLQEMFLSLNRYDLSTGTPELFEWDAGAVASEDEETPDDDLPVGTERIRCGGIEQVAALTDTRIAVVSRCKKEEVVEDAEGNKSTELLEKGANLFLADVVPSADFPGQLDVVFTHRVTPDQGIIDCGDECWMFDGFVYGPAFSPDGTQIAFLQGDEDETRLDFGEALYVADLSSGSVTELGSFPSAQVVNPTWSPLGKWIAVGVAEFGGFAGPRGIQVVAPGDPSPQLMPVTDNAAFARILSWYKPLLLLP